MKQTFGRRRKKKKPDLAVVLKRPKNAIFATREKKKAKAKSNGHEFWMHVRVTWGSENTLF